MNNYCEHLSAILLHSRVRMKISVYKVLLSSCRDIDQSFILPLSFVTSAVFNEENKTFSRDFEDTEPQNKKKITPKSTQKPNASQLSNKNQRNFTAFDLIDYDVL